MGYAPVARITKAPSPPESGTVVSVFTGVSGDTPGAVGDRFPNPPFVAIMWPNQEVAIFDGPSQNAEKATVVAIYGDDLHLSRGNPPVSVFEGMNISAFETLALYDRGQTVRISATFPSGGTSDAGTLTVKFPQGEVASYSGTQTLIVDGEGAYHYDLEADQSGFYAAKWELGKDQTVVDEFFVRYDGVE
jgi:hypothetical protein